jgi:peptidoglycan glycosyltransferase
VGYSYPNPGRAGLEQSYNDDLSGRHNELKSVFDELRGKQKVGDDLLTTLDPAAQRIALSGLAGRPGAVVALDPTTGAVKVMASIPGYDPNAVASARTFSALNRTKGAPLLNRATQAGYPPGSTFKVVTAIAAIDSGRYTPQTQVSGQNAKEISGVPLNNDANESFGMIDLTTALTNSVNTVWAEVAEKLGKPTMKKYMERLGFDEPAAVDLPRDQRRPSGEFRNNRVLNPTSRFVDVGRMGIGQDKLNVTPLQMAMVASSVANGGVLMRPHMGARIVDADGRTVRKIEPEQLSRVMSPETASQVRDMMKQVVKEGTGTAAALTGIDVAGKTGTAEIDPATRLNQPWFIAFAPAERPRVAIAVTVERSVAGFGGTVAAPIAKQVMEALLR